MKKEYTQPSITVISLAATEAIALTASNGDILIDTDELDE